MVKSIQYGMAEPGVLEVLRELLDIMTRDNKKSSWMQEEFLLGIVRMRGGALHMGKGRSNNAGKATKFR